MLTGTFAAANLNVSLAYMTLGSTSTIPWFRHWSGLVMLEHSVAAACRFAASDGVVLLAKFFARKPA